MDGAAHKLLESTTHRTLHANAFSRTSSQASLVLTDLLSRYLTLLLTTSAKYAQHAGRSDLTARDGLSALEELGVNLEELSDYVSEGRELNRYAVYSARRLEDLRELKGQSLAWPRQFNCVHTLACSCPRGRLARGPRRCDGSHVRAHPRRWIP
jgi:histone H3/H4